jgi:hydrogenase maturation protease
VKTLIIGIGNLLRSDDGVGLHVLNSMRNEQISADITLKECATGFDILNEIIGGEKVVIVDAIKSGGNPGTLYLYSPEELQEKPTLHTFSSHEADFLSMLELGKRLYPGKMPENIIIVAIEAADVTTISDKCTPQVERAIPNAVEAIKRLL